MSEIFSKSEKDVETTFKEIKYKDDINEIIKAVNTESRLAMQRKRERQKKRRKKIITRLSILLIAFILAIVLIISGISALIRGITGLINAPKREATQALLDKAKIAASNYDYDKAIEIIMSYGDDYDKNSDLKKAVINYSGLKSTLVKYSDNQNVTHISFRTLIYDTKKAFDGDENEYKYNRNMTTVNEFSNILTELYNQNYILVSIKDIAKEKDGKFDFSDLYLPQGKKPLVISQEDVSYSSDLSGDGFASKLIIDKNGAPKSEYKDENGKITTGNFDLIPILEDFIKKHPDFSYKGARAIIGVTGYDGVLGYRTNKESENFIEGDIEKAKKVSKALKKLGYEFASNSFDYIDFKSSDVSKIKKDIEKWNLEVGSIVGETDILIYPDGNDIKSGTYNQGGEKYSLLRNSGFNYFCFGDNSKYSVTLGETYLKQGRRILSGYRLENESDDLFDLFDIGRVIDISRPDNN